MTQDIYLIVILTITGFIALGWFINLRLKQISQKKEDTTLLEWAKTTQADIKSLQSTVSKTLLANNQDLTATLQTSYGELHKRLDKAALIIGDLKKEAGQFSEVSRSMKELHEFLRSPKLRGNIGEQVLKDLISQMFPKSSFYLQHTFKSGFKVDAAIKTDAGILPIDSKFPMENFQRLAKANTDTEKKDAEKAFVKDVKKHIDAISSKYILPEEGTMDFALMYLPSEPVYYEVANQTSLMEYARRQRVYPVGPTTMYAALRTIMLAYEGKKMETKGREVIRLLRAIQKDYQKLDTDLSTLGSHIGNAYNKFSQVDGSFTRLGQKLDSTNALTDADPVSSAKKIPS